MIIKHDIPLQTQSSASNCLQTSTSILLSFYAIKEIPTRIEAAVPVSTNAEGKPIGTLFANIGTWLQEIHNVSGHLQSFIMK